MTSQTRPKQTEPRKCIHCGSVEGPMLRLLKDSTCLETAACELRVLAAENEALRAEVERLRASLEVIADPIGHLQDEAKRRGEQLNGVAAAMVAKDGHRLSELARAALQPQTRGEG